MNPSVDMVLATSNGTQLTSNDFLRSLKLKRQLKSQVLNVLLERQLLKTAEGFELTVSDVELQAASVRFRYRHGLQDAERTRHWLQSEGLSVAEWEESLRNEILLRKLAERLVEQVGESHFSANRERFGQARVRRIVVAHEHLARELATQILEEGRDFADVAKLHSIDEGTRNVGGDLGVVLRCQMPSETSRAVFEATIGAIVGPVIEENGFALYHVAELLAPEYNDATRSVIRTEVLARCLQEGLSPITLHI